MSTPDERRAQPNGRTLKLVSLILLCIGAAYLVYGSYELFTKANDYLLRWVEQHYVFQGKNPLDVQETYDASQAGQPAPDIHGRDGTVDPHLGPTSVGYPPWAYFTGAALTWAPSFAVARFLYGLFNLLVLAGLVLWAYRLGAKEDRNLGLFFAASFFAVSSICSTFVLGQYGVLVLGALVATLIFEEKNNWIGSGLCLALALTKVTLTGPFGLPFLFRLRLRMLFVTGAYVLLTSLIIGSIVKTNPIEMLGQMTRSTGRFDHLGCSLNNLLELCGLGVQPALKSAAIICILLAMVLLYLWRSAPLLTQYAIVALAARAWSYHAVYDNLILVFILLDLGLVAWKTQSRLAWCAYFLVGISLWLPGHATILLSVKFAQWALWVAGLAVLLSFRRHELAPLPYSSGAKSGPE